MSCSFFDSKPESKPDWKAYVLRELGQDAHRQAEAHLATCSICHEEVATLRLTLDTLSTLREEEIPRRIAFVSDKVFEPRWWQRASRQTLFSPTFAAGVLVAAAILVHGSLRPGQAQVDAAVTKAVSQVEARQAKLEAQHALEIQVLSDLVEQRDKQVANMYITNAALIR
jgi:anti-sigma factor RsiW